LGSENGIVTIEQLGTASHDVVGVENETAATLSLWR
jgi:hypothetical protein